MNEKDLITGFINYLRNEGYRLTTYNGAKNIVSLFLIWLKTEQLNYLEASYNDLLSYINHLQEKGNKKSSINGTLIAIRHFYNYLQNENKVKSNPAETLRIRNITRQVPHDLLEWEELENIYKNFASTGITGKRNKAMLGLMIYQGLTVSELYALEEKDIKLEEGKIYVPQTGRSNNRILKLEAFQVIQLQKYITQIRPVILQLTDKTTEKLFISTGTGERLSNSLSRICEKLRKYDQKVKNFKQIRASVITYWLKTQGIRQVQYMTGHRYISSTERYRTDTLENLQDLINELHPLG